MNLLSSSELKLDRQQEKAIYELTLKKQRSKKSTMSEKQVAAMQQLASELVSERKDFRELLEYQTNQSNKNALNHHQNHHNQHQLCRCSESTLALAAAAAAVVASGGACERDTNSTGSESTASSSSGASTSSSRSAASLSPSSSSASDIPREQVLHITTSSDLHKQSQSNLNPAREHEHERRRRRPLSPTAEAAIIARHKNPISGSSFISTTSTNFSSSSAHTTTSTSSLMSDETNIKLSQLRLEQLNNELERRLHQYEYLVAQEKAILGAYKMNLFTSEGVNNFHLFSLDQRSQYYK